MRNLFVPAAVLSSFGTALLSCSTATAFVPLSQHVSSSNVVNSRKARLVQTTASLPQRTTDRRTAKRYKTTSLSLLPLASLIPDHQALIAEVARESNNLLQQYGELLRQFPLTTKSVTAAVLAFCGDAIAQFATKTEEQEEGWYDLSRGLTFLGFGAIYTGAFQHVWFEYLSGNIVDWGDRLHVWGPLRAAEEVPLDSLLETPAWWSYFDIVSTLENPPSPAMLAAAKVSVNQFLMVPSLYMPLFFFVTSQFDLTKAKERAEALYVPLLTRNYFFWLPTQFVQFFLLPTEWQIPFLSVASLVWTVILSSIGTQANQQGQEELTPALASAESSLSMEEAAVVLEEEVTLKDVREAFVSKSLDRILQDDRVGASAAGLAIGVLAAAADDAALAEAVSNVVGTRVGGGVAVVSALGAGAGLALSSKKNKDDNDKEGNAEDPMSSGDEQDPSSSEDTAALKAQIAAP